MQSETDQQKTMLSIEECEIHVSDEVAPFSPLSQSISSTTSEPSAANHHHNYNSCLSTGFLTNEEESSQKMSQQRELTRNNNAMSGICTLDNGNAASYQRQPMQSFARTICSSQSSHTRKTTKQAHDERLDSLDYKLNREMAYKIGTILMSYYKDNKLPAYRKKSPIDLVAKINAFFGLGHEYITTREISAAVKKDHIGKTPPRRGTKGRLPEGSVEALADLFFSFNAMCQYNGEKILTRPEQIVLLETIIDDYFKKTLLNQL
jgi:hypothetical protein